jgi:pyruvate/2-oxoglutarate dehydrogenase complex dihydrolipoamide acyltransferase (E2) component
VPNEITIPRLGWSMEEAIFVGWLQEPGAWVEAGEVLFTLETDKATQDIEALDAGCLQITADAPQPGERVLVGRVIGRLLGKGETAGPPSSATPLASGLAPLSGSPGATAGLPSSARVETVSLSAHVRAPDRAATPAMRRAQKANIKKTQAARKKR